MALVTSAATLKAHGRMFECKRAALIAVAIETATLSLGKGPQRGVANRAMRVVTIDAAHRVLGHTVVERLLELSPHDLVAARALLVYGCGRAGNEGGRVL